MLDRTFFRSLDREGQPQCDDTMFGTRRDPDYVNFGLPRYVVGSDQMLREVFQGTTQNVVKANTTLGQIV